jgi:hypothetical protein
LLAWDAGTAKLRPLVPSSQAEKFREAALKIGKYLHSPRLTASQQRQFFVISELAGPALLHGFRAWALNAIW